jgi:uncharacterized protein (TIGR00290 family)
MTDIRMPEPIVMCWSGGKDSALALFRLRRDPRWNVVALLTTLTREFDRVSMHGVRRELIVAQADSLGLPLHFAEINPSAGNAEYERAMLAALSEVSQPSGARHVAFGDLFLEDIRAYRESMLADTLFEPIFPIWGEPTGPLYDAFVAEGYRAVTVCVDPRVLDESFIGHALDAAFRSELPAGCDPCGENGEYHSFVSDGPDFRRPIAFRRGDVVRRDGFLFQDLLPVTSKTHD